MRKRRALDHMRILLHALHYGNDPGGAGPFNHQLGTWLVERGHQVAVISTPSHYPSWSIAPEDRISRATHEQLDGVDVHRVPLWVPPADALGARNRIRHELSFNLNSIRRWVPELGRRPGHDVVISICPPLQTAVAGLTYARLRRIPFVFFLHDLQVDQAIDLGMVRNPRAIAALRRIERRILRSCDLVATHTPTMRRQVLEKGVDEQRTTLLPTWVDTDVIHPGDRATPLRAELGVDDDQTLVLYAGGMGEKHGLELVLRAADLLRDRRDVHIAMIGAGPRRTALEQLARELDLPNLTMWPLQPLERMNEVLASGDAHLVIQRAEAADLMMPAKLTSILAAGRASIGTASPGTAVHDVLHGHDAGLVVPPDDPHALADAIVRLAADAKLRARLGAGARRYALEHLAQDVVLGRFEQRLREVVA